MEEVAAGSDSNDNQTWEEPGWEETGWEEDSNSELNAHEEWREWKEEAGDYEGQDYTNDIRQHEGEPWEEQSLREQHEGKCDEVVDSIEDETSWEEQSLREYDDYTDQITVDGFRQYEPNDERIVSVEARYPASSKKEHLPLQLVPITERQAYFGHRLLWQSKGLGLHINF
jgi:hypothetical protein